MEMRTILAAIRGGSASFGTLDLACRLALRFRSHVEAFHVQVDPQDTAAAAAEPFGVATAGLFMDQVNRASARDLARSRSLFDDAVRRHGLAVCHNSPPPDADRWLLEHPSASWREEMGYSARAIANRARLFDLLVLGRSGRVVDEPHSDSIEEALLTSGRPVLIAPAEPPKVLGETIAIAWNDSPECAKAVAAAIPFLVGAREVHVLSVGSTGAAELARHLGWYNIRANADAVYPVEGVGVGELALAAARDHQADLLVMGGSCQRTWEHSIPKTSKPCGPRISIQFRTHNVR